MRAIALPAPASPTRASGYVRFTFQNSVNGEWMTPVSLSL
jgi:hypothetical protein